MTARSPGSEDVVPGLLDRVADGLCLIEVHLRDEGVQLFADAADSRRNTPAMLSRSDRTTWNPPPLTALSALMVFSSKRRALFATKPG
jgi:hypothetical protein